MKLTRSSFLRYAVPILTIFILTGLLTLTILRLAGIQREMRNNLTANMVWVIYQAHIESLMLDVAVQSPAVQPSGSSDPAFRYQMLLSRLSLLRDGPQMRALQVMGMADDIAAQMEAIEALAPLITASVRDMAARRQVHQHLAAFSDDLARAANEAMLMQWEEAGARMDNYRNAVLAIIFLMIGILASAIFISIQLLFALKKAWEHEQIRQRELVLQEQLENERKISELYRSFGAMVSHQFRTPLAIIDASMQRLIRAGGRLEPHELARRAAKARAATQRLTHLIDSILNADRYMEQLEVNEATCCLAELAALAVAEQQAMQPGREFIVSNEAKARSHIVCDPILTGQILDNLLSNAIKYSPSDTPVSVRVFREGGSVCCAVSDTGSGIAPDDMPHIFKRYFRAWSTTAVVGTGIGLYIAYELATLQKGTLRAASQPGLGSTFTLCFPASEQGAGAHCAVASRAPFHEQT